MGRYSDTTDQVIALAIEKLHGVIPEATLERLKQLAGDGQLESVAELKKAIDAGGRRAEDR